MRFVSDRWSKLLRHVVMPTLAAVAFLAAILGTFLYLSTSRADRLALAQQEQLVDLAVRERMAGLVNDQEGSTLWDDAVLRLRDRPLDFEWLDNNLGTWFHTHYGIDEVYIVAPDGAPVYAMQAGRRASPDTYATLSAQLQPLVTRLRGRLRGGYLAPEGTDSLTVGIMEATLVHGRPALLSLKPVVSESGDIAQPAGTEYVHVVVRYLERSFLDQLSTEFGIAGARFDRDGQSAARRPVRDSAGRAIGWIEWVPFAPGQRVAYRMIPVLLACLGLTAVVLAMLLYRIWCGRIALEASRAQAQYLAFHDALTGLPNRALFEDRLKHALSRRRSAPVAIVMLDLDRFKNVNDTLGHHAGDALIRQFGTRLSGLLRDADTVARLGGDEFALLIEDARAEALDRLCDRILDAVRRPFDLFGNKAFVGISAGVAYSTGQADDASDITRKADIALYRAKGEGRNCYRVFDPSMDETVRTRSSIERRLRAALATGDGLRVHYQPEVSGSTGEIVGFEALVRWNHPTHGPMAPEHFIPVAEETGLIMSLGEWVLEEACRTSAQWPGLFFAVNLSPVQFQSANMVDRFVAIARRHKADPARIQLEVTEQVLLNDSEAAKVMIGRLRSAGFQVVLDDFGTGYSSLSYLREFRVDKIKIDRSFINYLKPGDESASIVLAMLALGQAIGLTVTAEGVETDDQRRFLAAAGCTEMQGFLFSRAVPEEELAGLIACLPASEAA